MLSPPSAAASATAQRPLTPQIQLPTDARTGRPFTSPQAALSALDTAIQGIMTDPRKSANPYMKGQLEWLQSERDRITASIKPMAVHPGETLLDPQTGQPIYSAQSANPKAVAFQQFLAANPDATPQQMEAFIQAGTGARSGIGMYMNHWLQENPDANADQVAQAAKDFNSQNAAQSTGARTLATRASMLELASNEALTLIPRVKDTSEKVDRTQYPSLNSIILKAKQGTGDPNVVRFGIAASSLVTTYARVLKPNGQITEGDTARAQDILDKAWSKGQIDAALDQMQIEIKAAQDALKKTQTEMNTRGGGDQQSATPQQPSGQPQQATPGLPAGWSVTVR
jgi:hypothetical protein